MPVEPESPRRRFSRLHSRDPARGAGRDVIDGFAEQLDLAKLTPAQFIQVLETLHMLGSAGAGVELGSMSTEALVNIVSRASKEQVKAIADHPELRAVFLDEIFRRMSDHFVPERAKHVDLVIGWRFPGGSGEDGLDRFQTVIADGVCVSTPELSHTPDTTITLSVEDFVRIATGNAAMAAMFVTGRVKVKGEYAPAVRLSGYFDIPRPG